MAKIGCELSFTLRIGNLQNNEYTRFRMNIEDIDTEIPVDIQLGKAKDALDQVWKSLTEQIGEQVTEIQGMVKK